MKTYQLSAFADEITPHFEDQLRALNALRINYISLRLVDDKNIIDYTVDEVQTYIKPLLDRYNIRVSSIGSPIGKVNIHDCDAVQKQFGKMKNLVAICQELDVHYIRMFSYYNTTDKDHNLVLQNLQRLLDYVKGTKIVLLHENEKDIYGDTADKCLSLAKSLQHPQFQLIFDPANFVQVKEQPKQAFTLLKEYVKYLHLKDARYTDSANVLIGMGDGEVPYIVQACIQKQDVAFMTFEPHLVAFSGLESLEQGDSQAQVTSTTPYAAFKDSLQALKTMIQ